VNGLLTVSCVADPTDMTCRTVSSPTRTVSPGPITVSDVVAVVENAVPEPVTVTEPETVETVPEIAAMSVGKRTRLTDTFKLASITSSPT